MTARPAEFDARLLRYIPALKNLAAKLTMFDRQQRDDLLNDTIAHCLTNWRKYRDDSGTFYTWLVFSMRDCARQLRRISLRHGVASADIAAVPEWFLATPPSQEHVVDLATVMAHIDALKPRQAATIRMSIVGFTDDEIGAELGCTKSAVSQVRLRHRAAIVELLGRDRAAA